MDLSHHHDIAPKAIRYDYVVERKREPADSQRRIASLFERVGLDLPETPAAQTLRQRCELLDRATDFIEGEEATMALAEKIFTATQETEQVFTPEEQHIIRAAILASDIGKTGPTIATPAQQDMLVGLYQLRNIGRPSERTVASVITQRFGAAAPVATEHFVNLNIGDPETMTMEELYNYHTTWTHSLLTEAGVPDAVINTASLHHKLKGDFVPGLENDALFDRSAQLVNLLDIYEAVHSRSEGNHADAMRVIRDIFLPSNIDKPYFENLVKLVDLIDRTLGQTTPAQ